MGHHGTVELSSPIRRRRDGRYAIRLDPNVRAVLANLAQQLPTALEARDPITRRLFPPAYPGAAFEQAEQEYRKLVDTALVNHHRKALDVLAATADADTLSEEELNDWLAAVGSLRLVFGTRLDVSEDMVPPDPEDLAAAEYGLYEFLGELQYLIIEVLAAELPERGRPEGAL